MKSTSQILSNSSMGIVEKTKKIEGNYQLIKSYNVDDYIKKITERKDKAINIRNLACTDGSFSNLAAYIANLKSLESLFVDFRNQLNSFRSRADSVFSSFSSEAYMNITAYFNVIDPIYDFFDAYRPLEDDTKKIIDNLTDLVKNYNPKEFITSKDTINKLHELYKNIENSLSKLCHMKQVQLSKITGFRDLYKKHLE